jgi:hypothetical protein
MVRKSNNNVLNAGLFQLKGMVYYRQCCRAGAVGLATFWSWSLNYWSGSGSGYVNSKILLINFEVYPLQAIE